MPDEILTGKAALVTGGGVRVGRAVALSLAGAGADIAIHYRSSRAAAEETAAAVLGMGRRAAVVRADLARPQGCRELVRSSLEQLGRLDFLVHCAANFHRAEFSDTDETIWDDSMNVNARAAFLMAREASRELAARGGRIVLVSDLLAADPVRGYLAHAVSKAAVEGLVRALAVELAPNVLVNGVAPGTVLVPEGTPAEEAERYARRTLLGRNGSPEDVARTVLFLCSGPTFLTGQILRVDGGQSIR